MPFGINSAPKVWQQQMTQTVEGLNYVEVIADDFLIYGVGDTTEEAVTIHDLVLQTFLSRACEQRLKLNPTKIKLRHSSVLFIDIFSQIKVLQLTQRRLLPYTRCQLLPMLKHSRRSLEWYNTLLSLYQVC